MAKRNRKQSTKALAAIGAALAKRMADLAAIRPASEDDDEIKAYLQQIDEALAPLLRGVDEHDAEIAALLQRWEIDDAEIDALLQRRTE